MSSNHKKDEIKKESYKNIIEVAKIRFELVFTSQICQKIAIKFKFRSFVNVIWKV